MSVQNLNSFDPFADEGDPLNETTNDVGTNEYIHIRIQQRNGRKTLTTLQGLPKQYDPKKLLKAFKKAVVSAPSEPKRRHTLSVTPTQNDCNLRAILSSKYEVADLCLQEFACNGTLVEDEKMGQVIQLQGDQRAKISTFLVENGLEKSTIKVHGF